MKNHSNETPLLLQSLGEVLVNTAFLSAPFSDKNSLCDLLLCDTWTNLCGYIRQSPCISLVHTTGQLAQNLSDLQASLS